MNVEQLLPILQSLIASAIYSFLMLLGAWISSSIKRKIPKLISDYYLVSLYTISLIVVMVAVLLAFALKWLSAEVTIANLLLVFLIYIFLSFNYLYKLRKIGIAGCDARISSGLDYSKSLRLVTNDLCFLGIGASKLVSSEEFECALKRITSNDGVARFLLCDHHDIAIEHTALRAGKGKEAYRDTVKSSLNALANLKNQRAYNIEVRFYDTSQIRTMPIFRIMLINNDICLVSYAVYGFNDGKSLPQVHFYRNKDGQDSFSFYFPFEQYFKKLWDQSTPWNFEVV